ncbi:MULTISPECIES: hypothetical protein [Pseudomonas syringae group]|uniref:hypothetical protein n=1 Tax=Pseudomonas syringae group TaxID=136849 RepID=UPI0009B18E75|nr:MULTISPECIES: hypothetical protein [Pseudomonas syringae group]ARA80304.1 hypothetical protein B5U27_09675 [Pseudomonas amygdali pv. lachrymans]MCK9715228.1 hypothetical protein [Pseudomonas syringae pv. syringae]MCK9761310.1 hypothetical protein [Pseudomonas syringae pv. syringae]
MKPDLPKRLESKVRNALAKVQTIRDSIVHSEIKLAEEQAVVDEFESDPVAFAARKYPRHDVDSYPVQTHISRKRESIEYQLKRKPERWIELEEAEANLARVEAEVLAEVASMRPSSGRLPYPSPLPPFEVQRQVTISEHQAFRIQEKADHAVYMAEIERESQEEDAELQRQSDLEDEQYREERRLRLASMTEDERQVLLAHEARFSELLRSGKVTVHDVIAHLNQKNVEKDG